MKYKHTEAVVVIVFSILNVFLAYGLMMDKDREDNWKNELNLVLNHSRLDEVKTSDAQKISDSVSQAPCPVTATSSAPGNIIKDVPIKNDFNGSEYPNRFRIVNGEQWLQFGCYLPKPEPLFQTIVYVDTAEGQWQEVYRGPTSEKVRSEMSMQSIAEDTISVLPGGRYASFRWVGYEWGGPVIVDLLLKDEVQSKLTSNCDCFWPVPVVSPTGQTLVFISIDGDIMSSNDGIPTVWLARQFNPLKLEKIFESSTSTPSERDEANTSYIDQSKDVVVNDQYISFTVRSNGRGIAARITGKYVYDIKTGKLNKI